MPERQNRHATAWWYYLLFPKQKGGYGPKQMMLGVASMAGKIRVNQQFDFEGFDHRTQPTGPEERFSAMTLGWAHDGETLHHGIYNTLGQGRLSADGFVESWSEDATPLGGRIEADPERPFGLKSTFRGPGGTVAMRSWGDPGASIRTVEETIRAETPLGNYHALAHEYCNWEGTFTHPGGTEQLEGIGTFHRVCINHPWGPWKWLYVAFADGSIFSCYVPYAGPHLFRKSAKLYPKWLEKAVVPLMQMGLFVPADTHETLRFDRVRMTPVLDGGPHPRLFQIECQAANGDHLAFEAMPYDQTLFTMERPPEPLRWKPRYYYNEYCVRTRNLRGRLRGQPLDLAALGTGYGNAEYTWGLAF